MLRCVRHGGARLPALLSRSICMLTAAAPQTTGLDPSRDKIVSIAASCRGEEYVSMVNPKRPIPFAATRVHGIKSSDVGHASPWSVVGPAFWNWVSDAAKGADVVLVAHNGTFDLRMLSAEDARLPERPKRPRLWAIDTLRLCRAKMPLMKSHRQAAVYEELFGAAPPGQHDALFDVRALVRICAHATVAAALAAFAVGLDAELRGPVAPKAQSRTMLHCFRPTTSRLCKSCGAKHSTMFAHACAPPKLTSPPS